MSKAIRPKGVFAAATDIGRIRISNDDQAIAIRNANKEVLLAVCDGMGGAKKGDYASRTAIDILQSEFKKKKVMPAYLAKRWMTRVLRKANAAVYRQSISNSFYEGMGTTLVAVMILGEKMIVANVGDSRAYRFDGRNLTRLTSDDTVGDYLTRINEMTEEDLSSSPERHILTNAIGVFATCASTIYITPYLRESILLCSDGLYNNVPESAIRAALGTDERTDEKVINLIAEANANGGTDNIGLALWENEHD